MEEISSHLLLATKAPEYERRTSLHSVGVPKDTQLDSITDTAKNTPLLIIFFCLDTIANTLI